jgi:RNA polymerase sigma factor (sigma-70 family)
MVALTNNNTTAAPTTRRHAIPLDTSALGLLRLAQAGDRDAFADIYRAHLSLVRRYLTVRLRPFDPGAVDDLVQDTFCAALADLDHADEDVRGWLLRLAAKMVVQHRWSTRRYLRAALTIGEQQRRNADNPAAPAIPPPGWRAVVQALADLQPDERLTVQLRILEAHPRTAAAAVMNCSVHAVSRRQRRALRRLAERLGTSLSPAALAQTYPTATA